MSTPVVSIEGLSIASPGGQQLIENTSFAIGRSEIVIVVGRSASGKSTLVNLLCGLLDVEREGWRIQGSLKIGDRTVDLARERPAIGALVFQRDALLDEFTAAENLQIAADHATPPPPEAIAGVSHLLAEIDPDLPVTRGSGGMRQRIAIGRTLMIDRPVLFLDEPNSGLDVGATRILMRTLTEIRDALHRSIVVVAHHVDELMDIADRVYVFDDEARTLRQMPRDAAVVKAELSRLSAQATDRIETADAAVETAWSRALARGRPDRWFFRYLLEYGWALCANPLVFAFTAAGGAIVGGVATWFGFNYRSIGRYLIPLLHDETLAGLGIMLVTVGVPLVVSVMLAARNAAVVAADLGNRSYALQFRAMRNLGIPGHVYIPAAITLAMIFAFLLLTLTSLVAASWASFLTWKLTFPGEPFEVWSQSYFRHFGTPRHPYWLETLWTVGKVALSGIGTAAAGMLATLEGGRSPLEINRSVGYAIVGSVLLALVIHAVGLITRAQI